MATEDIHPSSDISTELSPAAGGNNYDKIDEPYLDADLTTRLYTNYAIDPTDEYGLSDAVFMGSGEVTSKIEVFLFCAWGDAGYAGTVDARLYIDSTYETSAEGATLIDSEYPTGEWHTKTFTGTWTKAQVDAAQLEVTIYDDGESNNDYLGCTVIRVTFASTVEYPRFVSHGGIGTGTGTFADVPYPSPINENDILWACLLDADDDSFDTPTDWTKEDELTANSNASFAWYWKRATGSETGVERFTSTKSAGSVVAGIMARYEGCITTGTPYDIIGGPTRNGVTQSTTINLGSVTTQGDLRTVLAMIGVEDNIGISGASDYGADLYVDTDVGGDASFSFQSQGVASAGVVPADTCTTGNDYWGTLVLALIPEPSGVSYKKYIAEIINASEATFKAMTYRRLIFATEGLQEGISRNRTMMRFFSETEGLIEVARRSISFKRTINESIDIVENIATQISTIIKKFINETVDLIETTYRKSVLKRIISSAVDIIDSIKPVRALKRRINETIDIILLESVGVEEYDSIFINGANVYETYTTSGLDITRAYNSFLAAECYDNIALDTGKAYNITFDYVWSGGGNQQPFYRIASNSLLTSDLALNEQLTGTGSYSFYSLGQAYHGFFNSTFGADFEVYNLSAREVAPLGIRAVRALKRIISSVVGIVESMAHLKAMKRAISETIDLIESASTKISTSIKQFINEVVDITEVVATHISISLKKIINEAISITESLIKKSALKRIVSEVIDLIESITPARTMKRILASTISIVESIGKSIAGDLKKIINETVDLIESVARKISLKRILSEVVSLAESISTHISTSLIKLISETIDIIDSVNTHISATLKKIINETVDIVESVGTNISAALKKFISEVINLTETVTRKGTLKRILSESINIIESIVYPRALKRIISTTVELIETSRPVRAIVRKLISTLSIIESIVRLKAMKRIISESISIVEGIAKSVGLALLIIYKDFRNVFTFDNLRRIFRIDR